MPPTPQLPPQPSPGGAVRTGPPWGPGCVGTQLRHIHDKGPTDTALQTASVPEFEEIVLLFWGLSRECIKHFDNLKP